MYTDPALARHGVGRLVLTLCECAAAEEGLGRLELMSTVSGGRLYAAYGFVSLERLIDDRGGAGVPPVRMAKAIPPVSWHQTPYGDVGDITD